MIKQCCICLKEAKTLKPLNCKDNEVVLKVKLEFVAPEQEWLDVFSICTECNSQLDNAYNFKQLCLINDVVRRDFKPCNSDPLPVASSSENVPICPHCDKCFKSKIALRQHISTKHGHNCTICQNTFNTKTEFRIHKKTHHSRRNVSKFQCEMCGEHFSLLKNILEHCSNVHSMNKKTVKPYQCNECNHRFTSSTSLIQHKKYHNGDRTFVCSSCGKSFVTRRDLNGHEKLHENHRSYICGKCNKGFNTSQNLKTHIYVVHTDSSQWKYSCQICSKKFAMKANCNEHLKRHQGNKEFICHICKKSFVSNHEVKKHTRLHSNIAPFSCEQCEKHYRDRRSLNIHLAKAHDIGTVKPSVRVKKYVCHICPSQFYDNQKLQRHIRTHTGVKPFGCHECEKKFIDKSYLTHHLKSIHGVKSEEKLTIG